VISPDDLTGVLAGQNMKSRWLLSKHTIDFIGAQQKFILISVQTNA